MEVQILSLCDAATISGGKINILGIFDQIYAVSEPVAAPPCSVVIRMTFDKIEEGDKTLRIAFVDADGKQIMPNVDANLQVRVPEQAPYATAQIALAIPQLVLPHFGEYAVVLAVNGREEGRIRLHLLQIAPPQ
jgi:hypothetical protein